MTLLGPGNVILGRAFFVIRQDFKLSVRSKGWDEETTLVPTSVDPSLSWLRLHLRTDCAPGCAQDDYDWDGPLEWTSIDLHKVVGKRHRTWTGNSGAPRINVLWTLTGSAPGVVTPSTDSWGGGSFAVRCDNSFSGRRAGCVFPDHTPTLSIPKAYPAARLFIGMAQYNGFAHQGWKGHGKPLHRQADGVIQDENRAAICDSVAAKFVRFPGVPEPTCDEWPFAATTESGGSDGYKGWECQQFRAAAEPGTDDWNTALWDNRYTYDTINRNCARATMPSTQNSGVGTALSNFTRDVRLINGDAYWVDAGVDEVNGRAARHR